MILHSKYVNTTNGSIVELDSICGNMVFIRSAIGFVHMTLDSFMKLFQLVK